MTVEITDGQASFDTPSPESLRGRSVAEAQSILRGAHAQPRTMYGVAERLKDLNEFGYARRLYARIRRQGNYAGLSASPVRVGQRHALCTYKDPDLPAGDRFKQALQILDELDHLNVTAHEQQESAGLRGAIYKRKWQVEGQRADLERALAYYLTGYEMGPEQDHGYTGISAAFVLDILAREDAVQTKNIAKGGGAATALASRARTIRQQLANLLPRLSEAPGGKWLLAEWWFYTTRAEAHFGLGQFGEAVSVLRAYNSAVGLDHKRPPLERVAAWEFESTIRQLASLGQLQADLKEIFADGTFATGTQTATEMRQRMRLALRDYLGDLANGIDCSVPGKVGVALSGGGFRASLFHIGVLAHLAERDALRHVEVLSCVSGGSIVGAHYYLELQRLLEQKQDRHITRDDYVNLIQRLERSFLAGVQRNIRCRLFASIGANLRMFLQPSYSTTRRLGELYETELYSQVGDGRENAPRHLIDLLMYPLGESPSFKPKYDNWRRAAKVPMLVLNATTLNTGHNWQFTASWMGEPPTSLDSEIEGNYRLRRMYHWEAPRLPDRWRLWYRRPFAPPDYQRFRLGHAVAASSSVPGLFEPLVLPGLYEGKTVRLVDGGVYDNQGAASLLEQDCTVVIVSDASGQMVAQDQPSNGRLGVPLRSFSVSMTRVRQSQYQELDARRRSGLLKGLMFLHLKKDLDADPVDWRECQDPHEASENARPAADRGVLTRYGMQKSVQRLLSAIRTDLDSFTDVEAFALMTSGYRQAQKEFEHLDGFPEAKQPSEGWRFLSIEPVLHPGRGFDEFTRQLRIGQHRLGKVWLMWPPLRIASLLVVLAMAAGVGRVAWMHRSVSVLTVQSLAVLLSVLAAWGIGPHVFRIIRYGHTYGEAGFRGLVAAVFAIGFKLYLAFFDPIFLRLGQASRLLAMREPPKSS
jgi:predicted acylesterase/phospholipase RssA